MSTVQLGVGNFEQTITDNQIVFVDFWAAWCGPCRQFAPVYEKAATDHPDMVFGKVDTETEQALAASARITSIPTLMAFKDGTLVFSQPGALPAAALEQLITSVEQLDVEQARREAAAGNRSA
jgi:thioredoxin